MKDVPFDPASMVVSLVGRGPSGARYGACCDWRANLCDGTLAPVPAGFQIVPVLCGPHCRASGRSGNSAGRETGPGPACMTGDLVATLMNCVMT